MKKFYSALFISFTFSLFSTAQITIDDTDFADANDTARMSVAVWNPFLDFGATGANYTWDFSTLQWQSQYIDSFLNPLWTGPTYAFTFSNTIINPYRSNIAKKADNTLTSLPLLSSIFTDGINFYYKTTSLYRQRGIGMKVSGFPTPVPMNHADTLYRFPINYGNMDSSWSDYDVSVPQLGGYLHKQKRVNEVDGWGTLTTPFGTFDALRVRTEIRGSDSLFIDTLNFGIKVDNDIIREYKWFGKNQMEPLLQINTQAGILGQFPEFEFVTRVVYRDSARYIPVGIFDVAKNEIQFRISPNPASGVVFVSAPENLNNAQVVLTDISGRLVLSREINLPMEALDISSLSKGIYIITLQSSEGKASKKLVVD